mmetsp:Transcript_20629/g.57445  ORF Transcript_20629/g.57445 Transcript_20629/m.57445 type:complete len:83 (-) Transcript_20629:3-251(-)
MASAAGLARQQRERISVAFMARRPGLPRHDARGSGHGGGGGHSQWDEPPEALQTPWRQRRRPPMLPRHCDYNSGRGKGPGVA